MSEFRDFEDYEQALLDWRNIVREMLGGIQLPVLLGRAYYRPRVVKHLSKSDLEEAAQQYGEVRVQPTQALESQIQPPGHIEEDQQQEEVQKSEMEQDGQSPVKSSEEQLEQLPDETQPEQCTQESVKTNYDEPWDGRLLPKEPNPDFYDTYEGIVCGNNDTMTQYRICSGDG